MERWSKVDGYEWLEVSDHGRVRTIDSERLCIRSGKPQIQRKRGILMSPFKGAHGYFQVAPKTGSKRKKLLIHRLVALAFVPGYFDGAHVNHIDGNKENNHYTNLEWVTVAENTRKQWETGLVDLRGENHPTSKLSGNDVFEIRKLIASGLSKREIARRYGVSDSLIVMIAQGKRWSSLR